jgi:hypothetical protein
MIPSAKRVLLKIKAKTNSEQLFFKHFQHFLHPA